MTRKIEHQVRAKGRSFWSDGAESNDALNLRKEHQEDTVGLRLVRNVRECTMKDPVRKLPLPEKEWKVIRGASTNATSFKYSSEQRSSSEPIFNWDTVGLRVARSARQRIEV